MVQYEGTFTENPSDEDFAQATAVTVAHFESFLELFYEQQPTITLYRIASRGVGQTQGIVRIGFEVVASFAEDSDPFPTTEDLDIPIRASFQGDAGELLVLELQELDSNPFSSTTGVIYSDSSAPGSLVSGLKDSEDGTSPDNSLDKNKGGEDLKRPNESQEKPPSSNEGEIFANHLSAGSIAGIVIGALVVLGLSGVILYFTVWPWSRDGSTKKRKSRKQRTGSTIRTESSGGNIGNPGISYVATLYDRVMKSHDLSASDNPIDNEIGGMPGHSYRRGDSQQDYDNNLMHFMDRESAPKPKYRTDAIACPELDQIYREGSIDAMPGRSNSGISWNGK